ncbi:hypothetical protein [Mycolicibacterium alvei]|uniref:Uncharacterized protein n=1 Tax=Mycolicibacterium alvei TaxID=67081 RepID=A0A6N4UN97_9MYCO|nr:hypothetical protein [Mycolicibacterium alvei]MCV7000013.1 hypothetical protein [Mycolicibacterium alvei]BBX25858.1 hypothetical protein MALV_09830 [Mycolicibacterium alvei]
MKFPHGLLRTAAAATMGIAMWAAANGVAQADPADPQIHENSAQNDEPLLQCPTCTPEVQQLLAQVGPIPEPGPIPADWPAPVEVSVPVGVGPPGLPLPALPGVGLPQLPSPQDLPPPPPPPGLPPPPPPPGLPPPPWPFG